MTAIPWPIAVGGRADGDRRPSILISPSGSAAVGAGKDLDQRRFAGAVLAHDGVDFAGLDGQLRVDERLHAGEVLGDAAHLEKRGGTGRPA